ncbi:hypothetical protein GN956_G22866 [Arapaima gigas]
MFCPSSIEKQSPQSCPPPRPGSAEDTEPKAVVSHGLLVARKDPRGGLERRRYSHIDFPSRCGPCGRLAQPYATERGAS